MKKYGFDSANTLDNEGQQNATYKTKHKMQNIKYKMQNSTYKTQNREILENGEKGVESVNTLGNKGEPTTRGTK